jgi:hypothetical protein
MFFCLRPNPEPMPHPGNPSGRKMLSTIDLLALTSSDQLLFVPEKDVFFFFYKTSYLIKVVNGTDPFPSVRVPCPINTFFTKLRLCVFFLSGTYFNKTFFFRNLLIFVKS